MVVAPWIFDVLETGIFSYKENQISAGQLSADISLTETLYCSNRSRERITLLFKQKSY